MEFLLSFMIIAFIVVVTIDIAQHRRQRAFHDKYLHINESER